MLQLLLLVVTLALPQLSCAAEKEMLPYEPVPESILDRPAIERDKRQLINIEDLVVGKGAVAAWGRKIGADIEVRYTDGALVFRGPIYDYVGFVDSVFLHNAADQREEPGMLAMNQEGINLGLNGMAIGGHRRFTVPPLGLSEPPSRSQRHLPVDS